MDGLKKLGHNNAFEYIRWGEKQKNKEGILYPQIKSVQGRKNWYSIPTEINDELIYLAAPRARFLTFRNKEKFNLDKRLYSISPNNKNIFPILNSFINILHIEADAKEINNGNAKEFTVEDVKDMLVPNVEIKYNMEKLSKRIIKPIFEEVKQKDRKELDSAVLEALGLDAKEWLPKIYEGVCEMVRERLELPKMRKKQKKDKEQFSYEAVKQSVIKDVINTSEIEFPGRFYEDGKDYRKLEFDKCSITKKDLKIQSFLGNYSIIDSKGEILAETENEDKAKFIVAYVKTNNSSTYFNIPKDEKICGKIIRNYEKYVSTLKKVLISNANMKLHDWNLSEKMAKEILEGKRLIDEFK